MWPIIQPIPLRDTPTGTRFQEVSAGIVAPTALSVDGLGNFWVANQASGLKILDFSGAEIYTASPADLVPGANVFCGLATYDGMVAIGNHAEFTQMFETAYLVRGSVEAAHYAGRQGVATAYDASGILGIVDSNGAMGTLKGSNPADPALSAPGRRGQRPPVAVLVQ